MRQVKNESLTTKVYEFYSTEKCITSHLSDIRFSSEPEHQHKRTQKCAGELQATP